MSHPVEVARWEPAPYLSRVRHGVANLLVPLAVAAELLDDGSDASAALQRGVFRIQRASARIKTVASMTPPDLHSVSTGEVGALLGVETGTSLPGGHVSLDPVRVAANVVDEMSANGAALSLRIGTGGNELAVRSTLESSVIAADLAPVLAVPLTVTPGGVGFALACRETHLHGGRVEVGDGYVDFCFPYTPEA